MATTLAIELVANCSPLSDCVADHARHGLAPNQGPRIFAHRTGTASVRLQPRHNDGPRVGSAGAPGKAPNKNGNRHGWRATARLAPSTGRNGAVHSCPRSAQVRVRRSLLQCLFDAAKEWLSAKLCVCGWNDGPGF